VNPPGKANIFTEGRTVLFAGASWPSKVRRPVAFPLARLVTAVPPTRVSPVSMQAYMVGQLRLWKKGYRPATDSAAMMATIAQRLSDSEIDAVAAYFAQLAPDRHEVQLP
jgi:hypothetical protein